MPKRAAPNPLPLVLLLLLMALPNDELVSNLIEPPLLPMADVEPNLIELLITGAVVLLGKSRVACLLSSFFSPPPLPGLSL